MDRKTRTMKRTGVGLGTAIILFVAAACGGGGGTDEPVDTTVAESSTSVLVKNRPLNNCVSVMSGSRPSAGVTVPRCIPTTTGVPPTIRSKP